MSREYVLLTLDIEDEKPGSVVDDVMDELVDDLTRPSWAGVIVGVAVHSVKKNDRVGRLS